MKFFILCMFLSLSSLSVLASGFKDEVSDEESAAEMNKSLAIQSVEKFLEDSSHQDPAKAHARAIIYLDYLSPSKEYLGVVKVAVPKRLRRVLEMNAPVKIQELNDLLMDLQNALILADSAPLDAEACTHILNYLFSYIQNSYLFLDLTLDMSAKQRKIYLAQLGQTAELLGNVAGMIHASPSISHFPYYSDITYAAILKFLCDLGGLNDLRAKASPEIKAALDRSFMGKMVKRLDRNTLTLLLIEFTNSKQVNVPQASLDVLHEINKKAHNMLGDVVNLGRRSIQAR